MTIEVLHPGYADDATPVDEVARPASLAGLVVGLVSNGKQGTATFFDAMDESLRNDHGVAEVVRVTKASYSAPAEDAVMDRATRWNALIAGIGD